MSLQKIILNEAQNKNQFLYDTRNLHVIHRHCSLGKRIPTKRHLCIFHGPTFDIGCTEPTLLRLHCSRNCPCKETQSFLMSLYMIRLSFLDCIHFIF
jgi:hypothetical protein